jgi:hypothetical protein
MRLCACMHVCILKKKRDGEGRFTLKYIRCANVDELDALHAYVFESDGKVLHSLNVHDRLLVVLLDVLLGQDLDLE